MGILNVYRFQMGYGNGWGFYGIWVWKRGGCPPLLLFMHDLAEKVMGGNCKGFQDTLSENVFSIAGSSGLWQGLKT